MDENVWVKLVFILRWNAFIHLAIPFSLSSRCPHHSNLWKHFFLSVFSLGPCVSTSTECPTHGIVITQSLNSRCHLFSSRQILSSARASRLFWTLRATTWPLVLPLVIPLNCIYCRGWPQVSICISLLQVKLSKQRSHYSHASKPVPLTGLGLVQTAFFFFFNLYQTGKSALLISAWWNNFFNIFCFKTTKCSHPTSFVLEILVNVPSGVCWFLMEREQWRLPCSLESVFKEELTPPSPELWRCDGHGPVPLLLLCVCVCLSSPSMFHTDKG